MLRTTPCAQTDYNVETAHNLDEAEEVGAEEAAGIAAFLGQIDHDMTADA